jgi:hypothetical protein
VAFTGGSTRYIGFVWAAEAATGKWKWLFVNGSESKGLISAVEEFLNSGRDETNASICWGISCSSNDKWVD